MSEVDTTTESVLSKALKGGFDTISDLLGELDRERVSSEVTSAAKETKAVRRARWLKDLEEVPMEQITKLNDLMTSYVEEFMLDRLDFKNGARELEQKEVDSLAKEYVAWQTINDALQARHQQFRQMVFQSLNVQFEREIKEAGLVSDRPPEQMAGELFSEAYGVRFKREGGGRKDPTINWSRLQAELPEVYVEVCDKLDVPEQVVPAHTELIPNGEKLMTAVHSGKIPLETLREVLVPGAWMTPRFVPRKV